MITEKIVKSRFFRIFEKKNGVLDTYGFYYTYDVIEATDDSTGTVELHDVTTKTVLAEHILDYPESHIIQNNVEFICDELTKRQYQAGIAYNKYFSPDMSTTSRKMLEDNMFPTKDMAQMFARANSIVRVGYPNMHNVHKMNENRELSFVYHHDAERLGILPNYTKVYPV